MKSSLKIILMVVMAAAIAVIGLSWTSLFSDQRLLREKQAELEKSRETWEAIAAEKEGLQDELKEVENALKEAKLTLEEKTARAETLQAEIETLKQEIEALKQKTANNP